MTSPRTLFITRSFQYPPMGGGPLRDWQNINIMMKFGPVAVCYFSNVPDKLNHEGASPPGVALWSTHSISNKLPSAQKKIERRLRQLRWLLIRGHPYTDIKNYYYVTSVAQELDKVFAEFQPHLVVFEELWLYPYLPIAKRHRCRIILDAHNSETAILRETSKGEQVKGLKARLKKSLKLAEIESIERDFVRQADQVWACSEGDAKLLQVFSRKERHAHVIPNGVDVAYYESVRLGQHPLPSEFELLPWSLIFPASFQYKPNALGAQLLLEQVYPKLQETYPKCRLLLVGVKPAQFMLEAAEQDPGIIVTGKVPDIRPYLSASSVVIVPLLQGGGTRLKILEAFAAGRPVVSTSKGAEGLKVRDGEHLLIGDNPEELIAGVHKLWSNPSLGQKLADAAYELVRTEYSWEMVGQRVERAVQKLL